MTVHMDEKEEGAQLFFAEAVNHLEEAAESESHHLPTSSVTR